MTTEVNFFRKRIDELTEKLHEAQVGLVEAEKREAAAIKRDEEFKALEAHLAAFNTAHGENYVLWCEVDDDTDVMSDGKVISDEEVKTETTTEEATKTVEVKVDSDSDYTDLFQLICDMLG